MTQRITLIAAVASNRVIGHQGGLVFKLPGDLSRFKTLTESKPIIMGRKTWESLPRKPLPNRLNIVLTRQAGWHATGAIVVTDVATALSHTRHSDDVMVIGGGDIYRLFMPYATHLELTEVHAPAKGDTFFPPYSQGWKETNRQHQNGTPAFDYVSYTRA